MIFYENVKLVPANFESISVISWHPHERTFGYLESTEFLASPLYTEFDVGFAQFALWNREFYIVFHLPIPSSLETPSGIARHEQPHMWFTASAE
jgi:hypothetical protein